MPTLPACGARDLPPGVTASDVVWDETIAGGGYASRQINRGTRLRLTDLHGDGCVSMLLFNAERPVERLNIADTLKIQWNGYLSAGCFLLSDMGRVLMGVLAIAQSVPPKPALIHATAAPRSRSKSTSLTWQRSAVSSPRRPRPWRSAR